MTSANPFDFNAAENLFPNLINLVNLSTLSTTTSNTTSTTSTNQQEDSETRAAKLEIGKTATALRLTLANLKVQANQLKGGELNLLQQDSKIIALKQELELKRIELQKMMNLFPIDNINEVEQVVTKSEAMETD